MESAFYIMELSQLGNSIHHNIKKIDAQPKQGFSEKKEALYHLEQLMKIGEYPFDRWFSFTIMELIVNNKQVPSENSNYEISTDENSIDEILKSFNYKTIKLSEWENIADLIHDFEYMVKPNGYGSTVSIKRVIRKRKSVNNEPTYNFSTDERITDKR